MKIPPVEAELVNADGQRDGVTDNIKPIVAFLQFCESTLKKHGEYYTLISCNV